MNSGFLDSLYLKLFDAAHPTLTGHAPGLVQEGGQGAGQRCVSIVWRAAPHLG